MMKYLGEKMHLDVFLLNHTFIFTWLKPVQSIFYQNKQSDGSNSLWVSNFMG